MLFFNLFLFAKWMNTACKLETIIPNQAKRKVLNLRWYGLALLIGNANLQLSDITHVKKCRGGEAQADVATG